MLDYADALDLLRDVYEWSLRRALNELENTTFVTEVSEFLADFDELTQGLADEDKGTLRAFLIKGEEGSVLGNDVVRYFDKLYYVQRIL